MAKLNMPAMNETTNSRFPKHSLFFEHRGKLDLKPIKIAITNNKGKNSTMLYFSNFMIILRRSSL